VTGWPSGASFPSCATYSAPRATRTVGTWQASAGQRKVTLNSPKGHFTFFTPAYGRLTAPESDVVAEAFAVATFHLPHLAAGPRRVRWNGKKAGRYLMRIDATSAIGTSTLVAPFSLR
jgi:hypothetical protein